MSKMARWRHQSFAAFRRRSRSLAPCPHNEHMIRVADELGLMVRQELPVYSTIQWVLGLWPAVVVACRA